MSYSSRNRKRFSETITLRLKTKKEVHSTVQCQGWKVYLQIHCSYVSESHVIGNVCAAGQYLWIKELLLWENVQTMHCLQYTNRAVSEPVGIHSGWFFLGWLSPRTRQQWPHPSLILSDSRRKNKRFLSWPACKVFLNILTTTASNRKYNMKTKSNLNWTLKRVDF